MSDADSMLTFYRQQLDQSTWERAQLTALCNSRGAKIAELTQQIEKLSSPADLKTSSLRRR